jgi:hypothetical protein
MGQLTPITLEDGTTIYIEAIQKHQHSFRRGDSKNSD